MVGYSHPRPNIYALIQRGLKSNGGFHGNLTDKVWQKFEIFMWDPAWNLFFLIVINLTLMGLCQDAQSAFCHSTVRTFHFHIRSVFIGLQFVLSLFSSSHRSVYTPPNCPNPMGRRAFRGSLLLRCANQCGEPIEVEPTIVWPWHQFERGSHIAGFFGIAQKSSLFSPFPPFGVLGGQ